jgi:hypothetical protein
VRVKVLKVGQRSFLSHQITEKVSSELGCRDFEIVTMVDLRSPLEIKTSVLKRFKKHLGVFFSYYFIIFAVRE